MQKIPIPKKGWIHIIIPKSDIAEINTIKKNKWANGDALIANKLKASILKEFKNKYIWTSSLMTKDVMIMASGVATIKINNHIVVVSFR